MPSFFANETTSNPIKRLELLEAVHEETRSRGMEAVRKSRICNEQTQAAKDAIKKIVAASRAESATGSKDSAALVPVGGVGGDAKDDGEQEEDMKSKEEDDEKTSVDDGDDYMKNQQYIQAETGEKWKISRGISH